MASTPRRPSKRRLATTETETCIKSLKSTPSIRDTSPEMQTPEVAKRLGENTSERDSSDSPGSSSTSIESEAGAHDPSWDSTPPSTAEPSSPTYEPGALYFDSYDADPKLYDCLSAPRVPLKGMNLGGSSEAGRNFARRHYDPKTGYTSSAFFNHYHDSLYDHEHYHHAKTLDDANPPDHKLAAIIKTCPFCIEAGFESSAALCMLKWMNDNEA